MINNNINGILVSVGNSDEIADAILQIINNPDLADKLSANARNLLNTHSIEQISDKWLTFLKSI